MWQWSLARTRQTQSLMQHLPTCDKQVITWRWRWLWSPCSPRRLLWRWHSSLRRCPGCSRHSPHYSLKRATKSSSQLTLSLTFSAALQWRKSIEKWQCKACLMGFFNVRTLFVFQMILMCLWFDKHKHKSEECECINGGMTPAVMAGEEKETILKSSPVSQPLQSRARWTQSS